MIPANFIRFYKDGFGMEVSLKHLNMVFYYVSENQHFLDWVLEPIEEKFRISDTAYAVPVPEGTFQILSSLAFDRDANTLGLTDDEKEYTIVIDSREPLTSKAHAILPLLHNVHKDQFDSIGLPVYRVFKFSVDGSRRAQGE